MHEKRVRSKKQNTKSGKKEGCRKKTRVKTARVCKVDVLATERAMMSTVKNSSGAMIYGKKAINFIIRNNDLEGL
jgi:hypothetical protein